MNCRPLSKTFLSTVLLVIIASCLISGLGIAAEDGSGEKGNVKNDAATAPKMDFFRPPVKGVMETANPLRQINESVSRHDVVELLAVDTDFQWAKNAPFRTAVWNLRFEYKPLRMVWLDMPQKSGKMLRKPIYYMVYCVTNVPLADQKSKPPKFGCMQPVKDADGTYKVEYQDRPIRFIPEFFLESPEFNKLYQDRVIPIALGAILAREDRLIPEWSDKKGVVPRPHLQTSVDISGEIQVGETRWGVATWEDIDPRIDRFCIYVRGLTNAYKWRDKPGAYKKGDPLGTGRRLARKTLKLNFWRPGDEFYLREDEIRRGIPCEPDYEWVYQ